MVEFNRSLESDRGTAIFIRFNVSCSSLKKVEENQIRNERPTIGMYVKVDIKL